MEFHQTWYRGPPPGVDELIRFWARSAQCQGSKVNELVLNMLFFPVYAITQVLLDGISSNLVQGCTTRSTDELIRFWARSTQRQRSNVNELGLNMLFSPRFKTRNLKKPWVDFHQTWYRGAPLGVDELIRFWARSAQCQGSKVNELGLNMLFFPVYAITQVLLDGISSNLLQGCTTRSRWTD